MLRTAINYGNIYELPVIMAYTCMFGDESGRRVRNEYSRNTSYIVGLMVSKIKMSRLWNEKNYE